MWIFHSLSGSEQTSAMHNFVQYYSSWISDWFWYSEKLGIMQNKKRTVYIMNALSKATTTTTKKQQHNIMMTADIWWLIY